MRKTAPLFAAALALAAVGVTAAMHGEADDAPGLALIGIVLIVGALGVAARAGQRAR